MGEMATGFALVVGGLASLVFAVLLVFTVQRGQRHPEAWAEDRKHPVRHAFIATLPVSAMLLGSLAAQLGLDHPAAAALWWAGSLGQLFTTLWVMARWWKPAAQGGLSWMAVTPALFIPVVGNIIAPLGGVPLGHEHWAAAQFGIGLLFWPVVLVLLLARLVVQGPVPERLLPTAFILIAPPALAGLGVLQLGGSLTVAWACWGMAAFTFAWVGYALAGRIRNLPFALPHWGMSFPLAAFTSLTLRLAEAGSPMAVAGPVLLALTSIIILGLALATVRGLRDGTLLAPEPVAPIIPVTAA
jgi:tellurite resistance protein